MMSQPTPTPTPQRDPHRDSKKLPLIVDIAIDNNGKQMYQVHEYSKLVRKEMPRSTQFRQEQDAHNNNPQLQSHFPDHYDEKHEERTPVRKVLGTISPTTLNQKKVSDDDEFEEPVSATRKSGPVLDTPVQSQSSFSRHVQYTPLTSTSSSSYMGFHGTPTASSGGSFTHPNQASVPLNLDVFNHPEESSKTAAESVPSSATSTTSAASFSKAQDNDIWSDVVEQAFEEVLSIIPKNGLNKIKISGRSCGRNELISDYIYTKTGKFRTRKQVSSHIQVIKNLGQKLDIIRLINDGPTFSTEEESQENIKRFEEIFSKINLNKSMGLSDSVGLGPGSSISSSGSVKRKDSASSSTSSSKRQAARRPSQKPLSLHDFRPVPIRFENFFMSIYDSYSSNPIILSIQNNQDPVKSLKIKENANISARFPGLNDFQNCNIPIIHNMVKIVFKDLPYNYSIETGFKSNLLLNTTNDPISEPIKKEHNESMPTSPQTSVDSGSYSSFTCIYSYGKEVLKFNERGIKLNENRSFLVKFWKFFLSKLVGKDDNEINSAFKGMTIKQVIYSPSENDPNDHNESNENQSMVSKSKIRLVLLWEFAKVDDFKDATTTVSNLILPSTKIFANGENIVPQVVEYHQPPTAYSTNSTIAASPVSVTNPGFPHSYPPALYPPSMGSTSTLTSHPPMNSAVDSNMTSSTMNSATHLEPTWEKPQIDVQRKFQSLQQMQQLQSSQQHPHQHPPPPPPPLHFQQQQQQQQQYVQHMSSPSQPIHLQHQQPHPMNANQPYPMPPQNMSQNMPPPENVDFMMIPADTQDYQMGPLLYPGGFNEYE